MRLVRLQSRGGLVRTRMAGIRAARGEVLTFLDSHIEATHGWLEPLLDRSVSILIQSSGAVHDTFNPRSLLDKFSTNIF